MASPGFTRPATATAAPASSPAAGAVPQELTLGEQEFALFQQFFYRQIGIHLSNEKKALVIGRLTRRIQVLGLPSFMAYYKLINAPEQAQERQHAIDLITTNETFFFRESGQFDFLRDKVLRSFPANRPFRLWCAASSTGEEPYSLAMTIDACRGAAPWTLLATDISSRVLATAQRGLYQMVRTDGIPPTFLKRYCRKGNGEYANHLLVDKALRERVEFRQLNLMQIPKNLGTFDAVFIRNVIIYFDAPTKRAVLEEVVSHLAPGGLLFLGHSESLHGHALNIESLGHAIYRKTSD